MFSIIQAAGWPIWPLLACSVVALALIIERLMRLRQHLVQPQDLLAQTLGALRDKAALDTLAAQIDTTSALGRLLKAGLQTAKDDPKVSAEDLRAVVESAGRRLAHDLEKHLTALATIASAAPLLGLLGTVIGMIDIFGAQAPGSSNPVQLAQGISIALYNTAFGLMVAIPALMFWRYFRARVDTAVLGLELAGEQLVRRLLALRARAQ